MEFEPVIGLEVHAQLETESKMFSPASTAFGGEPNSQVTPICLGMPGVLPVLNKKALTLAVKAALALNCNIHERSRFARKNYFYPDLPKGYQISQYEEPYCSGGWLDIEPEGKQKRIRITRIHMEEDAGKLVHDNSGNSSLVDLNRAGVPLVEIVSEPDIAGPEEAVLYLKKLRSILRYIGVCDGNMEEGSLRCDANVSVRPRGSAALGTKVEIKNVNSFKFVQRAIEYEIRRQISEIEGGGKIVQETRLYDADKGVTFSMRTKEEAHDYRYFPDPDLLPVVIRKEDIEELRASLPELPGERLARFVRDYKLPEYDAGVLTSSRELADYFEETLKSYPNPKAVSNWIMTEVLREIGDEDEIKDFSVPPKMVAVLVKFIDDGVINRNMAKEIFGEMVSSHETFDKIKKTILEAINFEESITITRKIIEEKGIKQISDKSELQDLIEEILKNHPKEIARYKAGDEKLIGFFVGQVMKATQGKANPKVVNEILIAELSKR